MSEKARFFGRLGFRETVLPRALVASFWGLCMQWAVLAMEALTMASLLGDNAFGRLCLAGSAIDGGAVGRPRFWRMHFRESAISGGYAFGRLRFREDALSGATLSGGFTFVRLVFHEDALLQGCCV